MWKYNEEEDQVLSCLVQKNEWFSFLHWFKMIMIIMIHNHALIMYDNSEIMQIEIIFLRINQLVMLKQESYWEFITLHK